MKTDVLPLDGMIIREDTRFAPGVYVLPHGLSIEADAVTLEGDNTLIVSGAPEGSGIRAQGRKGITIRGLRLSGYYHGVRLDDCEDVTIENVEVRNSAEIEGIETFLYLWQPLDKVYSGDAAFLLRRPPVRLRLADGSERDVTLANARRADKAVLVKIAGIDDRSAAETLRAAVITVPRDALPPPEEGEFYACDLEGARVELASGEPIGTVRTIATYPTCDALVVDRPGAAALEIPLVETYVASVDVEAGLVRVATLEGLV